MALTDFQRRLCRLIADNRIGAGESYVAGGAALNELIAGPRISRDIDLFHDTDAAVAASWDADRRLLERHGLQVHVVRERPSYGGRSGRVGVRRHASGAPFPGLSLSLELPTRSVDAITTKL